MMEDNGFIAVTDFLTKQVGFSTGVINAFVKAAVGDGHSLILLGVTILSIVISLWFVKRSISLITSTVMLLVNITALLMVVLLGMHFYNIGLGATAVIVKGNAIQLSKITYDGLSTVTSYALDKFGAGRM